MGRIRHRLALSMPPLFKIIFLAFLFQILTVKLAYFSAAEPHKRLVRQTNNQSEQNGTTEMSIASFFNNISAQARKELQQIVNNPELTWDQQNKALDEWAQRQGEPFNTVYKGLRDAYEAARKELDKQHMETMANQTMEVQEADAKIRYIFNNQFITPTQTQQQYEEQMAQFPESIRSKLMELAPYPPSSS